MIISILKIKFLKLLIILALVLLSFILLGTILIFFLKSKNQDKKYYGAILIGKRNVLNVCELLWIYASLGLFALYYYKQHIKFNFFENAVKKDFENVIKDKNCISIIIAGHGDKNYWLDSKKQKVVYYNYQIKKAQIIQLSCTRKGYKSFIELSKYKDISYAPKDRAWSVTNVLISFKFLLFKKYKLVNKIKI